MRTLDRIPRNRFVSEYVGERIDSGLAEEMASLYSKVEMHYMFDMDFGYEEDDSEEMWRYA